MKFIRKNGQWSPCEPPNIFNSGRAGFHPLKPLSGLYDFVDRHVTGIPTRIRSKHQWKDHLKRHGMTDDFSYTIDSLNKDPRQEPLDAPTSKKVEEAIGKAIQKVRQKSYSSIGKYVSSQQINRELAERRREQDRRRGAYNAKNRDSNHRAA